MRNSSIEWFHSIEIKDEGHSIHQGCATMIDGEDEAYECEGGEEKDFKHCHDIIEDGEKNSKEIPN